MFARKKRDDGSAPEAYNNKGELVQFISTAPGLKAKKDGEGGEDKFVEVVASK